MEEMIRDLEKKVQVTAEEFEASQRVIDEQDQAAAAVLERVISLVRPGIRAAGTRPVVSYEIQHHADVNYYGGIEEEDLYDRRCVALSESSFGPDEDCPRANEGHYGGQILALREDGVLVQFTYEGSWSRWQGSSWGWAADVDEYESALEAVKAGWSDVERYVRQLHEIFDNAVGSREKAQKKAVERSERLKAISALLK